jgi:pimeloyl-ACP methyl ester carboxylesterase
MRIPPNAIAVNLQFARKFASQTMNRLKARRYHNYIVIGHREGTIIAPRVAIDNSAKVKNVILMGAAQNVVGDSLRYQVVDHPLVYATQVLDKITQ